MLLIDCWLNVVDSGITAPDDVTINEKKCTRRDKDSNFIKLF